MGYYEGRRVRATFAKGKLQVNRALEKKVAPLTSDDCRWVFDHLKLCAAADRRPSCNGSFDEISQEWAMASLRSLKMMEHNPRFSKSFANFCEDACGGTPKSDAEVGRAICGLGRAAADRLAEERLVARLANPISGAEFLADWRKLVGSNCLGRTLHTP